MAPEVNSHLELEVSLALAVIELFDSAAAAPRRGIETDCGEQIFLS